MNTNQQLSLMSLFETGAHRGNRRSKLNPRLKSKVYGFSKGLCLVDLAQTNDAIDVSAQVLNNLGSKKRQVLVVGTSKHISPLVQATASKFNLAMPYVNNRWLGGTLTNWSTVRKTLKNKEKLEKIVAKEEFFSKLPRNEQLGIERELEKLRSIFDGLVNLKTNRPGAVIVLDSDENEVTIKEAQKLGIPVIAITNTSTVFLPSNLKTTICLNTNSIKAVNLVLEKLVESYNLGFKTTETTDTVLNTTNKPKVVEPRNFNKPNTKSV
jgi:small subunit ribosomal protein S2